MRVSVRVRVNLPVPAAGLVAKVAQLVGAVLRAWGWLRPRAG